MRNKVLVSSLNLAMALAAMTASVALVAAIPPSPAVAASRPSNTGPTCPGPTCPYTAPTANELGIAQNLAVRDNLERAAPTRDFTYGGQRVALTLFSYLAPTTTAGKTAQAAAEYEASHDELADYGGSHPSGYTYGAGEIAEAHAASSAQVDGTYMTSFPHADVILRASPAPMVAVGAACNSSGTIFTVELMFVATTRDETTATTEDSAEIAQNSVYAQSGGTVTKVSDASEKTVTAKLVYPVDPIEAGTSHPYAGGANWTCHGPQYPAGSAPTSPLPAPVTTIASSATGHGYYLANTAGAVSIHGDAQFFGAANGLTLVKPIVRMETTPTGGGYWMVASDGGLFSYGTAQFYGSMGGRPLNQPVVSMAAVPTGHGYWEVASDGGVFSFGTAQFYGSMGGRPLNQPVVGIVPTTDGKGYWMVAADGGVFAFGDAGFENSLPGLGIHVDDIVGIVPTPTGGGYWEVAADGGVFAFGDAGFENSLPGLGIHVDDIVGLATPPSGSGYWLVGSTGAVYALGVAFYGSD